MIPILLNSAAFLFFVILEVWAWFNRRNYGVISIFNVLMAVSAILEAVYELPEFSQYNFVSAFIMLFFAFE